MEARFTGSLSVKPNLKILLVPQPVPAGQRGVDPSTTGYVNIANQYPGRVRLGDVGKVARQSNLWTWRAVCVGGEVACEADGAITIRLKADGGKPFCKVTVSGGVCLTAPPACVRGDRRHRVLAPALIRARGRATKHASDVFLIWIVPDP